MDSEGLILASCSDNGTIVIHSLLNEDDKGTTIHFNEPVKCVCVENDDNPKKEKSFLVGCSSGKLIHHKQVWFTNKNSVLYQGQDSPVNAIVWRKDLIAWSDSTMLRVMNITTQSAVCYVNAPTGVSINNPFPCKLFWDSDKDLLIGWADSYRHMELVTSVSTVQTPPVPSNSSKTNSNSNNPVNTNEESETVARTVTEFQLDCIVCGVSSFDRDHLVIFGYVPPKDEINIDDNTLTNSDDLPLSLTNQPELKIVHRLTGQVVSCDILPLSGQVLNGPWEYFFLTTYMSLSQSNYRSKWSLTDININLPPGLVSNSNNSNSNQNNQVSNLITLGNIKGFSPVLFLISPEDLVIGKVRDVNDRVGIALQNGDLLLAANLAFHDKVSLRHYHYHDIISLYIEDLLDDKNNSELAASECARLIGIDVNLWERWIYAFIKRHKLDFLIRYVPIQSPRLNPSIYELIIESFFQQNSRSFLNIVNEWGLINPPLFSQEQLLKRLETSPSLDPYSLEALAQLYLWSKKYEKALNCYLEINYSNNPTDREDLQSPMSLPSTPSPKLVLGSKKNPNNNITNNLTLNSNEVNTSYDTAFANENHKSYIHVFELIEKEKLFDIIKEKVVNLLRLSKELSVALLIKHIDKLPVQQIVKQLKVDKRLLHFYLHTLFMKYEPYNTDKQYSEFHVMQVPLYAEFASSQTVNINSATSITTGLVRSDSSNNISSDSIKVTALPRLKPILATSTIRPSTSAAALATPPRSPRISTISVTNIVKNQKPLRIEDNFVELIGPNKRVINGPSEGDFMYFLKNSKFYPLDYALRECEKRKPPLYKEMVYIWDLQGNRREALNLLLREVKDIKEAVDFIERHDESNQSELWNDLVDFSLQNHNYLSGLLDYIGICNLDPVSVVSSIASKVQIPQLRQKMFRIIRQYQYQVKVTDKCNMILEEDALDSLRRLKQSQRRAIKVDPSQRCNLCARPVFLPLGNNSSIVGNESLFSQFGDDDVQLWGKNAFTSTDSANIVVFSTRQSFH
eukprot:gene19588-25491_t